MRHLPTFLFLLIVFLHPFSIIAQDTYPVSKADAFSFARGAINEKDVDFYLCEEPILNISSEGQNLTISQNDTWTFFIDAEPLKGWEHDCYLVCITKGNEGINFSSPGVSFNPIEIVPIEIGDDNYELTTGLDEKDYSFKWTDTNGKSLGTNSKIIVTPTLANNEFSVTALSIEGEMAKGSITLKTQTGLKSITPIVAEDFVDVELHNPVQSEDAILKINSLTQDGADLLCQKIPIETKQVRLDVSTLPSGMYVLTYFIGNQIIDNQKFNKK